ncbi:MAG: ABC transporter ATP-binding protein/permease, partial [Firmicutes bacterium]|nr:ABC transporter ATP-binding protein/permease [Bacillota bacterium]
VINHISFTLHKNEKVVLVGLNGSGKSTLIKLLLRMYEPDTGEIRINGVNIKEYKLSQLRANFSVYFQDMYNYNFTLRENFTIADDGQADVDSNATKALQAAYAGDILEKATKGMDTSITRLFDTDGIELSGGQHQKLALARALYRRHTALILDEPSSNLDPKAEHEIFGALKTFTDGKMTIFTSHRLSNVALADRILVLEKGRLVEDGTQEELLRNKHKYAELFQYQKEKYDPPPDIRG